MAKSKDCYLAIATNAPQASLKAVLQKHNILPFFDKILGVSLGIEPKPHPMMLTLIQGEARFARSVFVGDSTKDKQAAQNAKMPFLYARWYESKAGDNEFTNSDELKALLEKSLVI